MFLSSSPERKIHAFAAKRSGRCSCWFPDAMLLPIRMSTSQSNHHKSGEKKFSAYRALRNIAASRILERVFLYLPSFFSHILDVNSILNGVTPKTCNFLDALSANYCQELLAKCRNALLFGPYLCN